MNVPSAARFAIPVLLLGGIIPAGTAAAQGSRLRDSVRVSEHMDESTGYDRSYAVVFAQGQRRDGAVMWSCGDDGQGFVSAVRLGEDGADGATRRMVWSVDGGAPDTTSLHGVQGSRVWFVSDEHANGFAARARAGTRMAVRVSREGAPARDVEYAYVLAGADSALSRLKCAADVGAAGVASGREALRQLSTEPFLRPDGRMGYDPRPRGWLPQLLNQDELLQFLRRRFPVGLRDAGVSGEVVLRIRVQPDGRVDAGSVRVISASDVRFVPAAAGAVEILRFRPARRNGRVVSAWVTLPIQFTTRP